jgi:hypothetical protein
MDVGYYRDLVRPLVEGRKFILGGAVLAAFPSGVAQLRSLGAERPFIIASGLGTGPGPDPADAEWAVTDVTASNVIEEIRRAGALLGDPPPAVLEAIDRWDPKHEAVMLGHAFYTGTHVAGRPVWGSRRPEWEALEDKVRSNSVWEAAGIPHEASVVVPTLLEELLVAHHQLDRGMGTVIAGDAREGFNGGAVYLRWVRTNADVEEAEEFFARHCDAARVMPFLEGIPCSMQGMVFPDQVIAFRPCEMLVFRPSTGTKLHYGGTATFWDPRAEDRESMRGAVRAVGAVLHEAVGYLGAFTVDGIMTASGFLPTELNTRAGASIGVLLSGLRELPFGMIQRAVTEGLDLDFRPSALEQLIVTAADELRGGAAVAPVGRVQSSTEVRYLAATGETYRVVGEADPSDAKIEFGPGAMGGFVRFRPNPSRTPVGPSLAPRAIEALAVADDLWDLGLARMYPARSVR